MTIASPNRTPRRAARLLLMFLGAAALGLKPLRPAPASARSVLCSTAALWAQAASKTAAPARAIMLAQDDDASSNPGASPDQIEKYVAVYRAMQRNHSLTVQQAAAAQGLTVAAFRELEQRIEHDDVSRDSARHALAEPTPSEALPAASTPRAQP